MQSKLLVAGLTVLSLGGCANFTPPAMQRPLSADGVHWITYDSSRRGTLLASDGSKVVRSCAEPAPDTAYSFTNAIKGSTKKPEGREAEVDLAFNATAVALAGRDNLVLLSREAMFRLCEARANGDLTQEQYDAQFAKVLDQIAKISEGNQSRDAALMTFSTVGFQAYQNQITRQQSTNDDDDGQK